MGSLMSIIQSAGTGLQAYTRALTVVQNNVSNVNTPGYARQTATFAADRFQPELGDAGGVIAGQVHSSRDENAESQVRLAQQQSGYAAQLSSAYGRIQQAFPVSSQATVPESMTAFFNIASQLSVTPNDATLRQTMLDQSQQVAQAFQGLSGSLGREQAQTDRSLSSTISDINSLAKQIQGLNIQQQRSGGGKTDANADAQMHAALENLSQLVNLSATQQPDGTMSVMVAGQQPLVDGSQLFSLTAQTAATSAQVLDANGSDITAELTSGQLGAVLQERNTVLPGLTTQVNTLAQTFADQVNAVLRQGVDQSNNAPTQDLFQYNAASPASTLAVNSALTPAQLALASAGAPGGNGNALQLSALATANVLNGTTFTANYGDMAAQVGRAANAATTSEQTQASILTQTQALRDQTSGVSLDQEAASLITLEQGYQAISKMITVLDDISQSVIAIIR